MPKLENGPLRLNDSCQIVARALAAPAFAGARLRKRLKHLAGCRVHKMDKGTGRSGHCLVLITLARLRDRVGEPALHMKPTRGAEIEQSGHAAGYYRKPEAFSLS